MLPHIEVSKYLLQTVFLCLWYVLFLVFVSGVSVEFYQKLRQNDAYEFGADSFGAKVSLYENTLLISASTHRRDSKSQAGAGYIFEFDELTGLWNQTFKMAPADTAAADYLGESIALHDTVAAIGSSRMNSFRGGIYIYYKNIATLEWTFAQFLESSATGTYFASSIALNDKYLVVGASSEQKLYVYEKDVVNTSTGEVFYTQVGGAYDRQDQDGVDNFGINVAVSQNSQDTNDVLVGANVDHDWGFITSGSAYYFKLDPDTLVFTEKQKFGSMTPANTAYFGSSISINPIVSQNLSIICEPVKAPGSCYVYEKNFNAGSGTFEWLGIQKFRHNNSLGGSEAFGSSSDIYGNIAVVGASAYSTHGAAYVFEQVFNMTDDTSHFEQVKYLDNSWDPSRDSGDQFGKAVSAWGSWIAVSNTKDGSFNEGAVYMYTTEPITLSPTTPRPSTQPSSEPSEVPSSEPSSQPSHFPSSLPSRTPTAETSSPSRNPSSLPSSEPSGHPTVQPSETPTAETSSPSRNPSSFPSSEPSAHPTAEPTAPPLVVNNGAVFIFSLWFRSDILGRIRRLAEKSVSTQFQNDTIEYILEDLVYDAFDILDEYAELHVTNSSAQVNRSLSMLQELVQLKESVLNVLIDYTQYYATSQLAFINAHNASQTDYSGDEDTLDNVNKSLAFLNTMMPLVEYATRPLSLLDLNDSEAEHLRFPAVRQSFLGTKVFYNSSVAYRVLSLCDLIANMSSDFVTNMVGSAHLYTNISARDNGLASNLLATVTNLLASLPLSDVSGEYEGLSEGVFGDLVVSIINGLGNKWLEGKSVGSFMIFDGFYGFLVKFAKIDDVQYSECQINQNIELSQESVDFKSSSGLNNINCVVMTSIFDIYDVANGQFRELQYTAALDGVAPDFKITSLDLNTAELKTSNSSETENIEDIEAILGEADGTEMWLSACEPIILTFNTTVSSTWFDDNFPQCSYYNSSIGSYSNVSDTSCYVLNTFYDDNSGVSSTQCACLHTTVFSSRWQEYVPDINYEVVYSLDDFNMELLLTHPLGLIASFSAVSFFCLLMCIFRSEVLYRRGLLVKVRDEPLVSHTFLLLISKSDQETKKILNQEYKCVKMHEILSSTELNLFHRIIKLWWLSVKNDHIWLGICCRSHGTNYSTNQRLWLLMGRILITMAVSALFYGITRDTFIGDYTLVGYEALLGWIPVYMIGSCIEWAQPRAVDLGAKYKKEYSLVLSSAGIGKTSPQPDGVRRLVSNSHSLANSPTPGTPKQTAASTNSEDVPAPETDMVDFSNPSIHSTNSVLKDELSQLKNKMKVRDEIVSNSYMLRWWCRHVACIFIVALALLCVVTISVFCVYFDNEQINSNFYKNLVEDSECVNDNYVDISYDVWLNLNATQKFIETNLTNDYQDWYQAKLDQSGTSETNSFGKGLETSQRFLLELLLSHILTIFVYSPLITLLYPVLYRIRQYKRQPDRMTEGRFFTENEGFGTIDTVLDKVDDGQTIRSAGGLQITSGIRNGEGSENLKFQE